MGVQSNVQCLQCSFFTGSGIARYCSKVFCMCSSQRVDLWTALSGVTFFKPLACTHSPTEERDWCSFGVDKICALFELFPP
jgi:hypothetical protein|mmetsp:Transcript_50517/g.82590  ORF Transcript_50517/g.82590 Transcript_50517/m.82590 type:complete len:81 (+) Transcript_50517:573-815(+)